MKSLVLHLFLVFIFSYTGVHTQYFDSTQIETINTNRQANEGDLYLDTNKLDYRIGLTNRKLGKVTDDQKLSLDTINDIIYLEDGDSVDLKKSSVAGPIFYAGKFQITSSGNITISSLPFRPSSITFVGFANVESYNLSSDNGVGNNNNTIANSFGYMKGYARNDGGSISEQVICGGGNGSSINDISRYASSSHCIAIRYANNNGDNLGITSATLTSFNSNGFTINVDSFVDGLVILYEAHR